MDTIHVKAFRKYQKLKVDQKRRMQEFRQSLKTGSLKFGDKKHEISCSEHAKQI